MDPDWVLNQSYSRKCPILVTTDVAAWGFSIKDIRVMANGVSPLKLKITSTDLDELGVGRWVHSSIENKDDQFSVHEGKALKLLATKASSDDEEVRTKANDVVASDSQDLIIGGKMTGLWSNGRHHFYI